MIKHLSTSYAQRTFLKKSELKILVFKNFLTCHNFIHNPIIFRYLLKELSFTLGSFTSTSRSKNVCVFTGRTRAVSSKSFRLTRHQIREKSNFGLLSGVQKSSW